MASKLALYNDALLALGQERLSALTDVGVGRYALDDAYDKELRWCLARGFWNFAMRSVLINSDAGIAPAFGYEYAFGKPDDFVRLYGLSAEETMQNPLLDFVDEAGYWFAHVDPLYGKYVSSHANYGGDLSLWPETYADFVALRLACKTAKRITGSEPSDELKSDLKRALATAGSVDAMDEPPKFPPTGSWANSRGGGFMRNRSRWDGSFR